MTFVEEYGDETIRGGSSLRGAQRRSNPESRVFPDCFIPRNDEETGKQRRRCPMATTTVVIKIFLPFEDFLPFQDFVLPKPHFHLIFQTKQPQ
jgi:hypothetical protein